MRKTSPTPTILLALLALIVLGYANNAAFHSAAHPDADAAHQAALQQIQADKHKAQTATPQKSNSPALASPDAAITELTIGNPAVAPARITFGYTADEDVEQNPQPLDSMVTALQSYAEGHPNTSLQVICLDIPIADRIDKSTANVLPGVAKNGKAIPSLAALPGRNTFDAGQLQKALG